MGRAWTRPLSPLLAAPVPALRPHLHFPPSFGGPCRCAVSDLAAPESAPGPLSAYPVPRHLSRCPSVSSWRRGPPEVSAGKCAYGGDLGHPQARRLRRGCLPHGGCGCAGRRARGAPGNPHVSGALSTPRASWGVAHTHRTRGAVHTARIRGLRPALSGSGSAHAELAVQTAFSAEVVS